MNNKDNNFVSAVVYLHKNEKNLFLFLQFINNVLEHRFKKYEIICVDDCAGEEVIKEVHNFKHENENVTVSIIKMGFSHGLEASMNAGVDLSIGDFVFEFDSCFVDYEENLITDIYEKALEGYDIVAAVPPLKDSKVSSRFFYGIYNAFSNNKNKLMTERFRVISRRAINRVYAYSRTIPYRKAIYASSGLDIFYLRYNPLMLPYGIKFDDYERNDTAIDSLILFTNLVYTISMIISVIMAIFMVAAGSYTMVVYFGMNKPVEGWSSMIGLISAGFFAIFLIFTFIIKYLDLLLKLVFQKQKYMISSIEKL